MSDTKRIVYITGIGGNIGRLLTQGFQGEYTIRGNDRKGSTVPGAEVAAGDIADTAFLLDQFAGVDTVIHLAADPSTRATWESVRQNNIDGTYAVFEAARQAGVRRVIFASTNHVTGILTEQAQEMDASVPMRPDSLYGVSKAFGEILGRYYTDRTPLSVLAYRIGWMPGKLSEREVVERFKAHKDAYPLMWLSPEDCVRAFRCGVEADPDLKFGVYYIVSNNRDRLWDLTAPRRELGYEPQDDLGALFDRFGVPYDFRIPRDGLGG